MTDIDLGSDSVPSQVIADAESWRRHLHQLPELAYQERKTADFIATRLQEFGLQVHRGLAATGVIGTLTRGTSRRTIGIRADMDALPMQEHGNAPHASRAPGIMHGCGHDGHMAMALAAARVGSQLTNIDGTVHFIFQPAEENGGGGKRMISEGLFDRFRCDQVYALHNWPSLPLGTCVALDGAMMAALAGFEIVISGRGCHGAMPHEGTDSILAGCQLVSALHSIVSRNVDPLKAAVISPTQIHAGHADNVIPDICKIRGTTRWFDDLVGENIRQRIVQLTQSIAAGFGCDAQIDYECRYPATINHASSARRVRSVAGAAPLNLTVLNTDPSMASEDFAYMLQAVPGCYFWLGARKADSDAGLHSSTFDFNDHLLPLGTQLWVSLIKSSLAPE